MAENGVNGHQTSTYQWNVGLMNSKNKYLTAETFGKVNASGVLLKKKEIWCIEEYPDPNADKKGKEREDFIYIRSATASVSGLNRYLTSDRFGNVTTVEEDNRTDEAKFRVEYSENGKWAFKNVSNNSYFTGSEENVKCFEKKNIDEIWWSVQLYAHPHIHLRNAKRTRCVRLDTAADELRCADIVPWGADSLILLDFVEGKYTLRTNDNRYLNRDGTLQAVADENTMFSMEIHAGWLAFKDHEGRYLAGVGTGKLKCNKKGNLSKDEMFRIEDSNPQCMIISATGKSVSVKQGVDVSANQPVDLDEIEDTEIFQMEYNKNSDTWAFRSHKNTCWELKSGSVQITSTDPTQNSFFTFDWQDDCSLGIKGPDGSYLANKATGVLYSASKTFEDCNRFKLVLINRPLLILKSEFGFVGTSAKGSQFICNRAKNTILKVKADKDGNYAIQSTENNKFWNVGDDSLVYQDDAPTKFQFRFCGGSMIAIRAPNGCYLKGEQNGNIKATATEIDATSKWEF